MINLSKAAKTTTDKILATESPLSNLKILNHDLTIQLD